MSCQSIIDKDSIPAYHSGLNIFRIPSTNVSINRSLFREYRPICAISDEGPYPFRTNNDSLWSDLSRVYYDLELSLDKYDEDNKLVPISALDTAVGGIQSIGESFVQQLKIDIGTTEVFDSGNLYHYRSNIINELSYPDSVKRNFLGSIGYYLTVNHDDIDDSGFQRRCRRFRNGKRAHFLSKLDFDLGNQENFLINNVDLNFTLYRAKDNFLIQNLRRDDNTVFKLRVHSVKLYIKMLEVQASLNMTIFGILERRMAKYACRKTEIKNKFIDEGRTEIDFNIFQTIVPRRLTICFVGNSAFNGDIRLTPYNYKPYNITQIGVQAGGVCYPHVPYNMDFSTGNYIRPFVDLYEALGKANSADNGPDIDLESYSDGSTFFVIPLTSTLDDSCGFELIRNGTTTIHCKFKDPIPAGGIEMLVLGEFDQLISIDFHRRVLKDNQIG
jgi:hypothetical protein